MSARAIWKGVLGIGGESVPVKLYSGVEDRRIHFRLLHREDHAPVRQVMVNPETGEAVPREESRKAFRVDDETLVLLDDEELESLDPEASRDVELVRFVPRGTLDPRWYDRPYYLGPDGAPEAYFALVRALEESEREGIARWVMRNRRYVGALGVREGRLVAVTLRNPREIVSAAELGAPAGRKLDEKELKMARQLVEALTGELDLEELRDTYRDRVLELVEEKAETGEAVLPPRAAAQRRPGSLEDALEASLERLRKERRTA